MMQHPEPRGWVAQFHEWRPNITTDYHEMGPDSTYYFHPGDPDRLFPFYTRSINGIVRSSFR
ncbi:MAG: hypothetical protein Ct9H300mP22_1760 [Gammaproteobacteria bacterium]|nr:MAG: hypothetical protein Ct9H300mP22_1760 [Gammaproteobacteria bacterium]